MKNKFKNCIPRQVVWVYREGLKCLNQHRACGYMQNAGLEYLTVCSLLGGLEECVMAVFWPEFISHETTVWRSGWGKRIGWCTPKAHPDIPETCVWTWDYCGGTSGFWSLDIAHESLWFCLQLYVTERYSQCWQGEYSIVTSNLYWSCREVELLGECGRILSCDSGVVVSETTQSVHTNAHNSVSILPASMLDAIPCLWKCSRNSRTILYFTGQNVTAWKAGYIEPAGRVISI